MNCQPGQVRAVSKVIVMNVEWRRDRLVATRTHSLVQKLDRDERAREVARGSGDGNIIHLRVHTASSPREC